MDISTALALLALLIALLATVGLAAVYGRVRQLEAGAAVAMTGYAPLAGRQAPQPVWPASTQQTTVLAVLDVDCALCRTVWSGLRGFAADRGRYRVMGLLDRAPAEGDGFDPDPRTEILVDAEVRADLYEGYTPTVMLVGSDGRIRSRRFAYADTDVAAMLADLDAVADRRPSRAAAGEG